MYRRSDAMKVPSESNITIWRYMDFTKFVSLLYKRALFFPNLARLAETDPFEGIVTKKDAVESDLIASYLELVEQTGDFVKPEVVASLTNMHKQELDRIPYDQQYTFVNCWHINEFESMAMWKIYSLNQTGVAIKSTYSNLCESFIDNQFSPLDHLNNLLSVFVGEVTYIDYENERHPKGNLLYRPMYKRPSFAYERELRAISFIIRYIENEGEFGLTAHPETLKQLEEYGGLYFPVDLSVLIEKVVVAPDAPQWLIPLVQSVMGKYDLDVEVKRSNLLDKPNYY